MAQKATAAGRVLAELFRTATAQYRWIEQEPGEAWVAEFTTSSGDTYHVEIEVSEFTKRLPPALRGRVGKMWRIAFGLAALDDEEGAGDNTNKGEAIFVISQVVQACTEFMQAEQPDSVLVRPSDGQRRRVYAKLMHKATGYETVAVPGRSSLLLIKKR